MLGIKNNVTANDVSDNKGNKQFLLCMGEFTQNVDPKLSENGNSKMSGQKKSELLLLIKEYMIQTENLIVSGVITNDMLK